MSKAVEVNSFVLATNIAALRALTPRQGTNQVAVLLGASGKPDSKGGLYAFDPTNAQADNGNTVIKVAGVATGAWVKLNRHQDPLNFEQFGALVAGTFNKFVARGGTYTTVKSYLGTAGSTASTVVVAINGTTVATLTFAASATTATVSYASGSSFAVNDGDRVSYTVTVGTGAQNLAVSLDA